MSIKPCWSQRVPHHFFKLKQTPANTDNRGFNRTIKTRFCVASFPVQLLIYVKLPHTAHAGQPEDWIQSIHHILIIAQRAAK